MPCRGSSNPARTPSMSFSAQPIPILCGMQGEAYRDSLTARVRELGIEDHVVFFNQFVDQATLLDFISMCDVYVTPYLNEAQMTSGTLAYSFGLGKAVVSTPYWHAKELLGDGRGILVPFGDAKAIGREIAGLLTDDVRRHAMRKRAYAASRSMTWAQTAKRYLAVFETARESTPHLQAVLPLDRSSSPSKAAVIPEMQDRPFPLALRQHGHAPARRSFGGGPRARLLCRRQRPRLAVLERACKLRRSATAAEIDHRALCGLHPARLEPGHAPVPEFHELRSPMAGRDRARKTVTAGRFGRWPNARAQDTDPSRRRWAAALFKTALPAVEEFSSPRAWAFALLGLDAYCALAAGDLFANRMRKLLADRLMALFAASQRKDWLWFEDVLAYDNARLPQALIQTGLATHTPRYVEAGLRSLRWLMSLQTAPSGCFRPVGTKSFGKIRQQARSVRSAARRGGGDDFRVPCRVARGSTARSGGRGDARIRLVSGRKRPADGADRSRYGELFGWASSGSAQ